MADPGFAQRVFTLILQRLENGDGTELMDLRDRLTDDEMGRLSGIIARGGESADAKQEFSDCLHTIRAEQQKAGERGRTGRPGLSRPVSPSFINHGFTYRNTMK